MCNYVQNRNGTYYFRRIVPAELRLFFGGKSEWTYSLRTKDKREAAAAIGVVLTLTTNMAVKVPTAFMTGGRAYGRQVTIGVLLLVAGLWMGGVAAVLIGEAAWLSAGS